MKLKKNVNINSLVTHFQNIQQLAGSLAASFQQAADLFNSTKLGIPELNMGIDEEIMRFSNSYAKIEDLIKSL